MTHTPGPWKLGTSCDGFLTVTDGSKTICTVGAADLFPQIEIDATLIAAAPALLTALRETLELFDRDPQHQPDPIQSGEAIDRALAAIRQAGVKI